MNTPIFVSGDGKINPSQFMSIITVPQVEGGHKVFGFTSTGNVFELRHADGTYSKQMYPDFKPNLMWCAVATGIFGR